jgi:hypothetical protein
MEDHDAVPPDQVIDPALVGIRTTMVGAAE